jgi:hypothetical protein
MAQIFQVFNVDIRRNLRIALQSPQIFHVKFRSPVTFQKQRNMWCVSRSNTSHSGNERAVGIYIQAQTHSFPQNKIDVEVISPTSLRATSFEDVDQFQ